VAIGSVAWVVGLVLALVGGALLVPLATALALAEPALPFAISAAATLALAGALLAVFRGADRALDHRQGFLTVTLVWLGVCVVSGVPYSLHPGLDMSAIDGFFESASGYTTTGATVISGLDAAPRSVLLWRALTHWIGGMGMVLLGVAILPLLGVGGMQLFRAETTGLTKDRLTPRIAETAKLLWTVYVGLTVANVALLLAGGMSIFDSVCHAFATLSTGGFSTRDASLGAFASPFLRWTTTAFMLLGAVNFALLHRALTRGLGWREDPELRAFVALVALATVVVAIDLRTAVPVAFETGGEALEHAAFQVATIVSTTGFVTTDYGQWPPLSQSVLLALCFVGGMAGSTAGGPKVIRLLLLGRVALSRLFPLTHPRAVEVVTLGGRRVGPDVVLAVLGFVAMYGLLVAVGTLALSSFGHDLLTSVSAVAACLGNIGPGFGAAGPHTTFDFFEPGAKLLLALLMILGRLEIYTVLVLFTAVYWRG
jgi:trk system potassium uptake protein TrkH